MFKTNITSITTNTLEYKGLDIHKLCPLHHFIFLYFRLHWKSSVAGETDKEKLLLSYQVLDLFILGLQ
jgi:hypothetical protein